MGDSDGLYDKNGFRIMNGAIYFDAESNSWVWEESYILDEHLEQDKKEMEAADLAFLRRAGIKIPESSSDAKKTQS